jgi:hypothetical protein
MPPAYVLAALEVAGGVRFRIEDHADSYYYTFPDDGTQPLKWQDAVVFLASRKANLQKENALLRQAGPKPWWKDMKMLLVALPAMGTAGVSMSGQFDDALATLPPGAAAWAKLIIGFSAATAMAVYAQQHTSRAVTQAQAVKEITTKPEG